jgi:hypothetical protein
LVLPDPIIESVIAYVHSLLWCSRNAVTSKGAASIGFIPSDDVIDELFPKLWRLIRAERVKLQMQAMLA